VPLLSSYAEGYGGSHEALREVGLNPEPKPNCEHRNMSSELQLKEAFPPILEIPPFEVFTESEDEHRERIRQGVINLIPLEERNLLLLNSGFDVARQVGMLIETAEQSDDFQGTKTAWLEKTREDMFHFLWEFLARKPVLPINIALENNEVIAPRYGNRKLEDATNEIWRDGATKRAVKKLSPLVASSPASTLFVMTSPMGWVGPGQEVTESQTYLYKKNKDLSISGLTIRTSMALEDHETLLKRLGINLNTSADQISRIINVSETIAAQAGIDFKDVAGMMQDIMGTKIAWLDESTDREVSFDEIYENLEKIPGVDRAIQTTVDGFISSTDSNFNEISRESLTELAVELGKTILRMQKAIEITDIDDAVKPSYETVIYITSSMPPEEFIRESQVIQMMKGCTASNSSTSIDSVTGPRNMAEGWHDGTCRICHSQTLVGPCSICSICAERL